MMEETDWDRYGTGNYEKCSNCMAHCGYEASAVADTVVNPLKAFSVWRRGARTEGPMVPDIALDKARPAEYLFERQVEDALKAMRAHAPAKGSGGKTEQGAKIGDAA